MLHVAPGLFPEVDKQDFNIERKRLFETVFVDVSYCAFIHENKRRENLLVGPFPKTPVFTIPGETCSRCLWSAVFEGHR